MIFAPNPRRSFYILRRAVRDLFSMTPWPMEFCGAFVLWHYGDLFSSTQPLSSDFRAVVDRIMPNDAWGALARGTAYLLFATCLLTWLGRKKLYCWRIALCVAGMITWAVLDYSCWRADVPLAVWRWWLFALGAQIYVAMLIRARQLGDDDSQLSGDGARDQGDLHGTD